MKLCHFNVGQRNPFFVMAGPCVIEDEELCFEIASEMKRITAELQIPYIFKASFDKANRTSHKSYRGPGIDEGLKILAHIREKVGVPVVTDVHTPEQVSLVALICCRLLPFCVGKLILFEHAPNLVSQSISRRGSFCLLTI